MLSERFELHVGIAEPDSNDELPLQHLPEIRDVLEELDRSDLSHEGAEFTLHGYGYGADGFAVGILLTGLATLFLSGKRIEENVDAWVRLGKRVKQALQSLRTKRISVSISEPVALSVALSRVVEDGQPGAIRLISSTIARIRNSSLSTEALALFTEHPDRYYLFIIEADSRLHVVAVGAHGNITFHNVLSLEHWSYLTSD
jgi:hypothetical protein